MVYFINYIKVIATILITNSHYGGVWPNSFMAVGGLLGNVLFFAASGFCLYKIKDGFFKWYGKRILRIYPVMAIFTVTAVLFGNYPLTSGVEFFKLFIYPTNYPFLVWLMICYALFYPLCHLDKKYKKTIEVSFLSVVALWVIVYFAFVDKTVYHIDDVNKPFILFLYFSSMLIGALFRKHTIKFEKCKWHSVVFLVVSLIAYFATKILFSKVESLAFWQIVNQFTLLWALQSIFAVCSGFEKRFEKLGERFNGVIKYIAGITLQIYIVQFLIIEKWQTLAFPVNFLVVTIAILLFASGLYYAEYFIKRLLRVLIEKRKNKGEKD